MRGAAPLLQLGGVVVGFIAAVFLSVAQQAGGGIAQGRRDAGGREVLHDYVVLRYPRLWKIGLCLLFVGFLLQAVGYLVTWPWKD